MVHCPHCNSLVSVVDLQPEAGVGKCPTCKRVFELAHAAMAVESGLVALDDNSRERAALGAEVEEQGETMEIRVPWVRQKGVGAAMGLVLYLIAVVSSPSAALLMLPLLIGAGYFAAAFLLNYTVITASRSGITVTHGPVPWPGSSAKWGPIKGLQITRERARWSRHQRWSYHLGWSSHPLLAHYQEEEPLKLVQGELARFAAKHGIGF